MAFISLMIVNVFLLVIFCVLCSWLLLGIAGCILLVHNRRRERKGIAVPQLLKVASVLFCVLGAISLLLFAAAAIFALTECRL